MLCNIRFSKNNGRGRWSLKAKQNDPPNAMPGSEAGQVFKCTARAQAGRASFLLRKEVIHPHVPVGIPCYDLTPITSPTLGVSLLAVRITTSSITSSHGLTGGVYKPRERIHRDMLIRDY